MGTRDLEMRERFRDFGGARAGVCELYRDNHARQTLELVLAKRYSSWPHDRWARSRPQPSS